MRQFTLPEILTEKQIDRLYKIYQRKVAAKALPHTALVEELTPLMDQINKKLGHANDVSYIAYAIEHVFGIISAEEPCKTDPTNN